MGWGQGEPAELRGLAGQVVWLGATMVCSTRTVPASRDEAQAESTSAASAVASRAMTLVLRISTT